jgi:hypothetical protein
MSVSFDNHILYYSYGNVQGDDFCIGLFGNKEFWSDIVNRWNRNDGIKTKFTAEDFEDFTCEDELRGCQLAELEPEDKDYLVRWFEKDEENVMRISPKTGITWEENPQEKTSVPRWITRLKTAMKENDIT